MQGHLKKAGVSTPVRWLREVRAEKLDIELGKTLNATDIFSVGDVVSVTGISKGKGFAGGVKRWGFSGGPKTHGQSDRHRAPGSIGAGTTPGRVLKGKKMAGRMGNDQKMVSGLIVLDVDTVNNTILVSGPIPGAKESMVTIQKTGQKKFEGILKAIEPNLTENNLNESEIAENTAEPKEELNETSEEKTNS